MFSFNVRMAWRALMKNKAFSLINILGLSLGLAMCLSIIFFVIDELQFDRYNSKANRIFRLNSDVRFGNKEMSFARCGSGVAAALMHQFPEVENAIRLAAAANTRFKKGDEGIEEDDVIYSDPAIFDVFSLPLLEGDPKTALGAPRSAVISESSARKYFGTTQVLGKTLELLNDHSLWKITGMMRNMPLQSHFKADFFLSFITLPQYREANFTSLSCNTYLLLKPGANVKKLETKFPAFLKAAVASQPGGWDMDAFERGGNYLRLNATPLTSIHLESDRLYELGHNDNIQYIYIFSALALVVLVVACINYMNLSTARSAYRSREIGVRKVLGSSRRSLIFQFMSESLLVTGTASLIAAALSIAFLPVFNRLSGKELDLNSQLASWLLGSLISIIFIVGILAGSYPSFFLSGFRPVNALKGRPARGSKGGGLRSILVVFQFSASIFLISASLVIYSQLHFIQSRDLGFNRNQVLIVKRIDILDNPRIFKQAVKQMPGVVNATLSSFQPTGTNRWPNFLTKEENGGGGLSTEIWPIDEDYLNTMGMSLSRGRNFSIQIPTDSSALIINEAAAKSLGYFQDPLDKLVYYQHDKTYHIIGVVKDFNFSSLRENITPLVMMLGNNADAMSIRVHSDHLPDLLARMENKWRELSNNQPFAYSFMDEDFDAIYGTEQRMGSIFFIFTGMAVLIACLGLLGLAAYAAEQRNKEISIRKILGADISSLVAMLSRDFLKPVVISVVISIPASWYIMQKWLEHFAYRENMPWRMFVLASIGALFTAILTISAQSIKAARVNPVQNLKTE